MRKREIIMIVGASMHSMVQEILQKEADRQGFVVNEPEPIKITARPVEYIEPIVTLHQGPIGAILTKGKRKRW